jgi:aspartate racemase
VPGELHIGGVGLARGYLNQPELTVEKFIPNPFNNSKFKNSSQSNRLYKTGDLARYLPDGNIEFLGRIDQQVKIRGFRIEPGEIEAALNQHKSVREAIVVAREDISGDSPKSSQDKHLVAYVVTHQEPAPTTSELRNFLIKLLPNYMVPSIFVMLDALPLTPNGKVDRPALPAPDQERPDLERAFVAPRDTVELQLTQMWTEILGIHPIGVTDNFFDLGGHSLNAMRLFTQIKKIFGFDLPLATLFQAPTVEQQANILQQSEWSAPCKSLVKIQHGDSQPPLFSIHGGYTSVLMFYNLARYLGDNQSVYGLQPQGLDGKQVPQTRIEDMASDYIREIRTVQPQGPYFLAGFSMGGKVAYEMAQQLHAQGQKVAMLALFDTLAPQWLKPLPIHARVSRHLANLLRLEPQEKLNYLHKKLNRRFYSDNQLPSPIAHAISPLQEAHEQADKDYVPQVYPGRAILFRASEQFAGEWSEWCEIDPELGWGKLVAGGLEIHEVPGNHMNMFNEPNVRVLAEKLKACLSDRLKRLPLQH